MYKKSYYNLEEVMENGDMVLYNSRTGAVAIVEKEDYDNVQETLNNPNESCEYFTPLLDNGFLVEKGENEFETIRGVYEKEFDRKDIITVVLLPAEICNFTCEYCFVWNYAGQIMKPEVYDSIKKYIQRKIDENDNIEEKINLRISWFGGEPLLEREQIKIFMREVIDEFSDRCIVRGDIVTNGYYLTYPLFQELLDLNIRQFQVTFDGVKEDHDKTRCLKNGQGSFDTILENLQELVDNAPKDEQFSFAIRINFMRHTYKKIYGLIDQLKEVFKGDDRFYIYCRPVYNFDTKRDSINELQDNIFTLKEGLEVQMNLTLYIDRLFDRKQVIRSINDYLPMPTSSWCSEDNKYSIIIGADGSTYCCDSLVGDESVCTGKLLPSGEIDFKEVNEIWKTKIFDTESFNKKCKDCKLLPCCMGNCRRERLNQNTDTPCLFNEESVRKSMREYYNQEYSQGVI